ncbi:hypothetical protein [Pseudomonas tohonis]|uniref:hypothetical protein n=1 Tax=Pseudomonas tohonis TaxID=2725477 RepID=UPI0021D84AA0|nr:hypothetical protein [Pseudomonas tohonis]UXY55613.1 hypothetical protein N9L84_13890 [Pseudomonas tohonis]
MAKRILFVPFIMPTADANIRVGNVIRTGQRAGLDYFDKNDSWITSYKEKRSVQDEGTFHDIVQLWYHNRPVFSPLLRGLGEADQIYIRGHSLPDVDGIFDHCELGEGGSALSRGFNWVGDKREPLKISSVEANHNDSKHYGLKAEVVAERLISMGLQATFSGAIKCYNCHSAEGPGCFAQALVNELYDRGYRSCTVYGYLGALSSMYESQGEGKPKHKESLYNSKLSRASANRRTMIPRALAASSSSTASSSSAPDASSAGS